MPSRDHVAVQAERLRAAIGGCTRSEALALLVLASGAIIALGILWAAGRPGPADSAVAAAAPPAGEPAPAAVAPAPTGPPAPAATAVVVHVSGHVARPGVYDLPEGARVADAIHAAGGVSAGATVDGLNLARHVADGEQVHVSGPGEEPPQPSGPGAAGAPGGAWLPDGRLDINRATAAELEELPGIGPVMAERILAYRDEVGRFDSIGELLGVRGIGEKTLAALADLLAV